MSVDGAPRYEVRFTLDAEGRPTLDAAALEAQGPLRPGWFPAALRRASP